MRQIEYTKQKAKASWIERLALITLLFMCFVTFEQGDLFHTATSSYSYLKGHFFDFYDYNKRYMGGNDYLPTIYWIFAIWNIPLWIVNHITYPEDIRNVLGDPFQVLWWKTLLALLFFFTFLIINKIDSLLVCRKNNSIDVSSGLVFATSPIVIFAVFIFSGYDIISVFFTLLGFYYYLKKNLTKFAIFFSIAISLKFFALIIYLPLVLLIEKRYLQILKFGLIGIFVSFAELALYWKSSVFSGEIFNLARAKISGGATHHLVFSFICALAYVGTCLYCLKKSIQDESRFQKTAILIPMGCYLLMFLYVDWHPQWLIILFPFISLSMLYVENKKVYLLSQLIGAFCFFWFVANNWPLNVDVIMASRGPLRDVLPTPYLIISDLMHGHNGLFRRVLMVSLCFPLLMICYQSVRKIKPAFVTEPNLFSTFFIGISFFLIPVLICLFLPLRLATHISSEAYIRSLSKEIVSISSDKPVGEIYGENKVTQTFLGHLDNLAAISVKLATYARKNSGSVRLTVDDVKGKRYFDKVVSAKTIKDNSYYSLVFKPISDSKNRMFKLTIYSADSAPENSITAWVSNSDSYPDGVLYYGKDLQHGDLVMNLFYKTGDRSL